MKPPSHLVEQLRQAGQMHVLRFWDRLDDGTRHDLIEQLETIDWRLFEELQRIVRERGRAAPAHGPDLADAVTPPCLRLGVERDATTAGKAPSPAEAIRRGTEALAAGAIGAILVAGGQGSRLGCQGPKGLYKVGPVSKASLFEFLLGGLVAVRRRFGRDVPLAIMTSSATDAETRAFLDANGHCGLDPSKVLVFRQHDLPALDATTANLLLDAPGRVSMAPDGHGGMLVALAAAGGLEWFAGHGVGHVVSFQVDNPLAMPLHPEFLGCHLLTNADFSTQVVRKTDPAERVGVVVETAGTTRLVEYSDLPAALAGARLPDGRLRFYAGSIAVHAFSRAFLERAAGRDDSLPLHVAYKAVPFVDEDGSRVVPQAPNAIKFERFIFDLMPLASRVCVVEIEAVEGFAPLKNPPGSAADAPEHVHAALVARARRLLNGAGVTVADGIDVELDPAEVLDERDIARLFAPGTHISYPTVVGR
jgi:UDP-N-acetylglucosamine/UDP-N-acetylgalactosamine diphosphorylase